MSLRMKVKKDHKNVDFGIWKSASPSIPACPLYVHSGNVARKPGILRRKQNDAEAVNELKLFLHSLIKEDPVKYDFALFGLGVNERF
jgi:uncharacterized protein (TIGR02757 family)